ncbi:MAG: hypothetical protein EOP06_29135 [Proteobacteria bacterium]|nr:MAG: hypothetical protein EOP06_29135 [Pseudomonadota bacterium]
MSGLTNSQKLLLQRIDEVLFYLWDPIDVKEQPKARDEYYSYAGVVLSMMIANQSPENAAQYLSDVMDKLMGIDLNSEIRAENLRLAGIIFKYADAIASMA